MNVYDFDKTIYLKESTRKFYFFCLKRNKKHFFHIFKVIFWGFLRGIRVISLKKFKEKFFSFTKFVPDLEKKVEEFWDDEFFNINYWYFEKRKRGDVVCSASPRFLLENIVARINKNAKLVCTEYDIESQKIIGENCKGEEKVKRLKELGYDEFENGFSDSKSDIPMLKMCKKAYKVKKEKVFHWDIEHNKLIEEKPLEIKDKDDNLILN